MKVLHLGNVPIPAGHPDRDRIKQHPGRWVLNHALAQKAAGLDVEIVSQAHKAARDFDCEIEGVTVHFLRTFHPYRHLSFYALDSWRMSRFVRKLAPDIVHAHGTEAAYGHAAARSGLPFCITAQGLFFQIIPTLGRRPNRDELFLRIGEDFVLKRTKNVVAKSEYVKAALHARYPHLALTLIPNTYEPGLDAPLAPRRGHAIAYVGTVNERKAVHYLADAVKELAATVPDVELHICGNAPEGAGGSYENACVSSLRATLGERLHLHGNIPSGELFAVLDKCRALVAPSLEEMFGNQLIEALMRGCHGIVAEGTALAENARRFGNSTVVPQRDASAIAAALRRELAVPFDEARAEKARAAVRAYMSPAAVAGKHIALYRRILQETGAGRPA